MHSTTQYIVISLLLLVGLSSCTKKQNLQQSTSEIHTDFIAKNSTDFEKKASEPEIMVQFRGCKAHQ